MLDLDVHKVFYTSPHPEIHPYPIPSQYIHVLYHGATSVYVIPWISSIIMYVYWHTDEIFSKNIESPKNRTIKIALQAQVVICTMVVITSGNDFNKTALIGIYIILFLGKCDITHPNKCIQFRPLFHIQI